MIWADVNIVKGLMDGSIKVDPFDEKAIQPASLDLRLGNVFYSFKTPLPLPTIDVRRSVREYMVRKECKPDGSFIIWPQGFLLGCTLEKISLSNNVIARIEGKSSIARLGITIHSTGGFIDPGNQDINITLEISNHSPVPIKLYCGMWIAQLAFQNTLAPCMSPYGGDRGSRYFADGEPVPSRVSENLGCTFTDNEDGA